MKKIFAIFAFLFVGLFFISSVQAKMYTVKRGDILSRIAQKEMGSWKKYCQIRRVKNGNKVKIPGPKYLIYPGEKLWIPDSGKPAVVAGLRIMEKPVERVKRQAQLKQEKKTAPIHNINELMNQKKMKMIELPKKPQKEKKTQLKVRNLFEAFDSVNVSYSRYGKYPGEDKQRDGWNFGAKIELRPFKITNVGEGSIRMGAYGRYDLGESDVTRKSDGRYSHYEFDSIGGGLSSQYKTKYDEWDLNFGVLWHETDGWTPEKNFHSNQKDKLWDVGLLYKNEIRRLQRKAWFPEFSLGIRYQHPFDTEYYDSKGLIGEEFAYDERWIQFGGNLWIYDFYLDQDRTWRFTPGFNAYIGHHWGKESGFVKFGPMFKIAAYEQEIIELSVFNPKKYFEDDGSRFYWFSITWKIDDTIRAIYASQIKDYNPDDEGRTKSLREIDSESENSSIEKQEEKEWVENFHPGEEGVFLTSDWGGETPTG